MGADDTPILCRLCGARLPPPVVQCPACAHAASPSQIGWSDRRTAGSLAFGRSLQEMLSALATILDGRTETQPKSLAARVRHLADELDAWPSATRAQKDNWIDRVRVLRARASVLLEESRDPRA